MGVGVDLDLGVDLVMDLGVGVDLGVDLGVDDLSVGVGVGYAVRENGWRKFIHPSIYLSIYIYVCMYFLFFYLDFRCATREWVPGIQHLNDDVTHLHQGSKILPKRATTLLLVPREVTPKGISLTTTLGARHRL